MGIITSPPEASYANFTKYVLSNTCLSAASSVLLQASEVLHDEAPVLWPAALHPAEGLPNIQVVLQKIFDCPQKIFACTAGHGVAARGCLPVRRCDALRGERQHARPQGGQLPVCKAVNEFSRKFSLYLKNHYYLLQGRGGCGAGAAGAQLQLRHGLQGVHGPQRRRGGYGMLLFWTNFIVFISVYRYFLL